MPDRNQRTCRHCGAEFEHPSRKFCSTECRQDARARCEEESNPTPEEIRAICRQIHEEGGPAWERSRRAYAAPVVTVRSVRIAEPYRRALAHVLNE